MAGTEEHEHQMLEVEEGWAVIQRGINRLIHLIEGIDTQSFSSQEYMNYYTAVYNMCRPNPTGGICVELYEKYNNVFKDYINGHVLPSLQGKEDEALLKETEKRWSNHKVMTRWLVRFFHYLDRYFAAKRKVPSLQESAFLCFYNLSHMCEMRASVCKKIRLHNFKLGLLKVFGEFNNQIRDAVLSLTDREREGEDIDQALVKNIVSIYVDDRQGSMKYYERDFEEAMFKATTAFYSTKAPNWIKNKSYNDYMLKVECCLEHERETVSCYLRNTSQKKLLEIVEYELISVYETELKEKKQVDGSLG